MNCCFTLHPPDRRRPRLFDLPEALDLSEARQLEVVERRGLGPDIFLRARLTH